MKKKLLLGLQLCLTGCSYLAPSTDTAKVALLIQPANSNSPSGRAVSCYGLLVTGPKVNSLDPADGNVQDQPASSDHCTYPGISSAFVKSDGTEVKLEVFVPVGPQLLIQVVGVDSSGSDCPSMNVSQFILASRANSNSISNFGSLYEVGRKIQSFNKNTTIGINNSFDANNPKDIRTCTTGGSLRFGESSLTTSVSGSRVISAIGGKPPYNYTVSGGGSYNSTSKLFTASASAGTNTLSVTDSRNAVASLNVTVFDPNALATVPTYWFTADNYSGQADGSSITSDWTNRGADAPSDLVPAIGTPVYLATGGPNNFPAVSFDGLSEFHKSSIPSSTILDAVAFIVYRSLATNNAGLFCISDTSTCDTADSLSLQFTALNKIGTAVATNGGILDATPGGITDNHSDVLVQTNFTASSGTSLAVGGTAESSPTQNVSSLSWGGASGYLYLGSDAKTGTRFRGRVSEFFLYSASTALPNADMLTVKNYLKNKYSLP